MKSKRIITTIWVVIWTLIGAGLSTAIITSFQERPKPEIIIETCSLLAALLLVIVERLASRNAARKALLGWVIDELAANGEKLEGQVWQKDTAVLKAEEEDVKEGLRFYYPHLSTSAIAAAVLSTEFDLHDLELVQHLHKWRDAADECNARLAMAQLLFFFLPSTEAGMKERLMLHLSIRDLPVVRAREELGKVSEYLLRARGNLPIESDGIRLLNRTRRIGKEPPSSG